MSEKMKKSIYSQSRNLLEVSFTKEPRSSSWEELLWLKKTDLTAVYQGQLCPFHCGFRTKERPFSQIWIADETFPITATRDMLEALFFNYFEVKVLGSWYPTFGPVCATNCVVFNPDKLKGIQSTMHDSYMWGTGSVEVQKEQVEEIRVRFSESFLDEYYDLKEAIPPMISEEELQEFMDDLRSEKSQMTLERMFEIIKAEHLDEYADFKMTDGVTTNGSVRLIERGWESFKVYSVGERDLDYERVFPNPADAFTETIALLRLKKSKGAGGRD